MGAGFFWIALCAKKLKLSNMKSISKLARLVVTQPAGCVFSLLLAIILLTAAFGGMLFTFFAVASPAIIKDAIYENTGFRLSASNVYVNIFTGECLVEKLSLENPITRTQIDDSTKLRQFVSAPKVLLKISPAALLKGKLDLISAELEIDILNCTRTDNSTFNILEFMRHCKDFFDEGYGSAKDLKEIKISIKTVTYTDASVKNDVFTWSKNVDFYFCKSDITDPRTAMRELSDDFYKQKLTFISESLNKCL